MSTDIPLINTSPLSHCMLDHAPKYSSEAKYLFDEIRNKYEGNVVDDSEVETVAKQCAAIRIKDASDRNNK